MDAVFHDSRMAIIAGWWGIWDIFSGLALAWGLARVGVKTKVVS